MESIGRELIYIWYYFDIQLRQIVLFWVVGMAIGSAVSVFAKDSIHRLMPEMAGAKWGILGVLPAAVLGMLSPLCMYGTIPIAASFRRQGIREDWLASFMMTSILLNPQLIVYSAALGGKALVVRIVSAIVCGMTAGVLIRIYGGRRSQVSEEGFDVGGGRHGLLTRTHGGRRSQVSEEGFDVGGGRHGLLTRAHGGRRSQVSGRDADDGMTARGVPAFAREDFFDFTGFEVPESRDTDPNHLMRYVKNFGRNLKSTGLYFLIGILLSALFQRYVPAELMATLFGGNEAWGVLMAATVGVPLYVCGGGTIPLLQQWLADGMSLGSAAAFMITGPATKITNLGAMKIVLGLEHFILYLAFVMLFSLVTGLLVNLILS